MFDAERDAHLRSAAFAFLQRVVDRSGGFVKYDDVANFAFEGERIPLMASQQGIRKPRQLEAALSFRTAYRDDPSERPYDDEPGPEGYLRYKWRGTDPHQPDNVGMRIALERQFPLIWFLGVAKGTYRPVFPVWLVDEEPAQHQFVVALDEHMLDLWPRLAGPAEQSPDRWYVERIVHQRVHQPVFRARVLSAYGCRCSLCNLGHLELLDAAHIKADAEGGAPVVTNGIAMCKIHHAAYDADIVGIRPDYVVEVRPDVLGESDGPTLRHTLQGVHRSSIHLPRQRAARPSPDLLEERFERFRRAS